MLVLNKYGGAERGKMRHHKIKLFMKCVNSMMLFVLMVRKPPVRHGSRSEHCCYESHLTYSCLTLCSNWSVPLVSMQGNVFGGSEDFMQLFAPFKRIYS